VLEGFLRVTTHQSLTSEQKAVLERFRRYQGTERLYLSYKSHNSIGVTFTKMAGTLEAPFHLAQLPILEIVRANDLPDEIR